MRPQHPKKVGQHKSPPVLWQAQSRCHNNRLTSAQAHAPYLIACQKLAPALPALHSSHTQ